VWAHGAPNRGDDYMNCAIYKHDGRQFVRKHFEDVLLDGWHWMNNVSIGVQKIAVLIGTTHTTALLTIDGPEIFAFVPEDKAVRDSFVIPGIPRTRWLLLKARGTT